MLFKTEAVGAGGYNIQKFHFRYLNKLKEIQNESITFKKYINTNKRF
jgi:hypothetical protein